MTPEELNRRAMDEVAASRALDTAADRLLRDQREKVRAFLHIFCPELPEADVEKLVALVDTA